MNKTSALPEAPPAIAVKLGMASAWQLLPVSQGTFGADDGSIFNHQVVLSLRYLQNEARNNVKAARKRIFKSDEFGKAGLHEN